MLIQRPLKQQKSIPKLSKSRDPSIGPHVMNIDERSEHIFHLIEVFTHLHSQPKFQPWLNILPYSEEVYCLGINCKAIPRQVNFLADEAGDWVKEPIMSSVISATFLRCMDWVKKWCTCMVITVQDRTKTTA